MQPHNQFKFLYCSLILPNTVALLFAIFKCVSALLQIPLCSWPLTPVLYKFQFNIIQTCLSLISSLWNSTTNIRHLLLQLLKRLCINLIQADGLLQCTALSCLSTVNKSITAIIESCCQSQKKKKDLAPPNTKLIWFYRPLFLVCKYTEGLTRVISLSSCMLQSSFTIPKNWLMITLLIQMEIWSEGVYV